LGTQFRIEQGMEIERRARSLYPDGLLIDENDLETAHSKTTNALKDRKVSTIFGATFLVDGFVTKADVVQRAKGGWKLNEVKSSVTDKPELVDDLTYTVMVAERDGLSVAECSLLLISKEFRLGMENDRLFEMKDHTDEVRQKVSQFKTCWETVEKGTRAPTKPEPKPRFECKKCELLNQCIGVGVNHPIYELPRLSQKKYDQLVSNRIFRIEDIPDNFELTEIQAGVRESVKRNHHVIGAELRKCLGSPSWPLYYLDFETVAPALPLYPDVAPYEALPILYSVHRLDGPGQEVIHSDFLADPSHDARMELVGNLLQTLGDKGSIVVYGTFEKTMLSSLQNRFPSLSEKIGCLIGRLVNLERIVSTQFSHPDFHGATSMKKVLPSLVPEISYDSLEIKDGDSAMAAFAYLAQGRYTGEKAEEFKKHLRAYCCQDTLGLHKVHQRLVQLCDSTPLQKASHQTLLG
jgi:hypothetical protein